MPSPRSASASSCGSRVGALTWTTAESLIDRHRSSFSLTYPGASTVSTTLDARVADVLADPACSHWLRVRIREALQRDPLDALREAETLVAMLDGTGDRRANRRATSALRRPALGRRDVCPKPDGRLEAPTLSRSSSPGPITCAPKLSTYDCYRRVRRRSNPGRLRPVRLRPQSRSPERATRRCHGDERAPVRGHRDAVLQGWQRDEFEGGTAARRPQGSA